MIFFENAILVAEEMITLFIFYTKQSFVSLKEITQELSKKYPNTAQNIQLSFVYFFAFVDLVYGILNNLFSMGYNANIIQPIFPIIKAILTNPYLSFWASPEKVFFLSYFVIEFMVVRSVFKFSKLVRYHILLVFAVLMVQGLVLSTFDLCFHRDIISEVGKWTFEGGILFGTNYLAATVMFFITFAVFFILYVYLYISSLSGEFVSLKGCEWISDSVSFWLKIRTPTMNFGGKKRKPDNLDN
jgi:hypothetical protein